VKLPVSWLKEYLDVTLAPDKLADILTMSGTKVEEVKGHDADAVIDLEITTNRSDCLSILGLAREISVLTGKKLRLPYKEAGALPKGKTPVIRVEDKKGCPLYTARILEGVRVGSAPEKARRFLEGAGTRAISNAVDATNYVLFEMGHPLHAFDYDKLEGGVIVVRRSRKGEKFIGIDDVEYTLEEGTLVIADASKPVAIAGVIGGKQTEITAATKNILLEAATFDPVSVRRAARRYKIATESGYRFERGVNPATVWAASQRAASLILEWGGGRQTAVNSVSTLPKTPAKKIMLRMSRLETLLGMKVSAPRAMKILTDLGFAAKLSGKDKLVVTATTARRDVAIEADLIEEILRIEGFEKIPVSIPASRYASGQKFDRRPEKVLELKKFLAAQGLNEAMTYSLLSAKMLEDSGFSIEKGRGVHRVVNPVSAEQEYFRPSLLPGLLGAVLFNVHRKASSVKLFESGNCYLEGREATALGLVLYGAYSENWQRKDKAGFYDAKGLAGNALHFLGVPFREEEKDYLQSPFAFGTRLVSPDGERLGDVASLHPRVLAKWDIPHDVFFVEIDLDAVFGAASPARSLKVVPVPKYPSVRRDIAFVVADSVRVRTLEEAMKKAVPGTLRDVQLFDQFTGKNIPQGKRSLAFSLSYQKEDGTFTEDQISALQKRIGDALKEGFGVEFRA